MNEPASIRQTRVPVPQPGTAAAWAWPQGTWLGTLELQEVVAYSASGIVYRAWDHGLAMPVAIKEYLPAPLAARTADGHVAPLAIENVAAFERGLQAFIGEARKLAQCNHPVLVRMLHLLQAHGTAYRVMPWYAGRSLIEVRRDMAGPLNEASLRALLDNLLGALRPFIASVACMADCIRRRFCCWPTTALYCWGRGRHVLRWQAIRRTPPSTMALRRPNRPHRRRQRSRGLGPTSTRWPR